MPAGILGLGMAGSGREVASTVLGTMSMLCWGVAEIPQFITNFKCKSTAGLSLAFLLTWMVGDFLNVLGCWMEPATLPTQLYMAMMFSATTLLLTGQSVYYEYFYHRNERNRLPQEVFRGHLDPSSRNEKQVDKRRQNMQVGWRPNAYTCSQARDCRSSSSLPISSTLLPPFGSAGGDLYYMSARSLSSSPNGFPTFMSKLGDQGRASSAMSDEDTSKEPLLDASLPVEPTPPVKTKNMLCVVFTSLLFFANCGLHFSNENTHTTPGIVIPLSPNLSQVNYAETLPGNSGDNSNEIGTYLGWAMAAVYMGGRLPQICLNIRRGNVDGLSPFMFFFALFGNGTYIASILVRSLKWSKIRPNLPWLVDAGGCVLLDIFIVLQFIYYRYIKEKRSRSSQTHNILV